MSFEGKPAYRWVKMYRGVRYRVSCEELNAPVFTEEASYKLANGWWERQLAELNQPTAAEKVANCKQRRQEQHRKQDMEEKLRELRSVELLYNRMFGKGGSSILPLDENEPLDIETPTKARELEHLNYLESKLDAKPVPTDKSLAFHVEQFLALTARSVKPRSYREIRELVKSLETRLPPPEQMDERVVMETFAWLDAAAWEPATKKKRWGFFKRFVRYLEEHAGIDLPRNLESRLFQFRTSPKAVKEYDTTDVTALLNGLTGRRRTWALLGLNCGMTNADIAELTKDMVKDGILTRKRVKTKDNPNVPIVRYRLWPETIQSLEEHRSNHAELWFASGRNTKLVDMRIVDGKTVQKDLIHKEWIRAKPDMLLKAFRSIGATLLEKHTVKLPSGDELNPYASCVIHFLAHSPKSLKDRSYAAPPQQLFDASISWLRSQFFPS